MYEKYLMHYGVKGMRWGKNRDTAIDFHAEEKRLNEEREKIRGGSASAADVAAKPETEEGKRAAKALERSEMMLNRVSQITRGYGTYYRRR